MLWNFFDILQKISFFHYSSQCFCAFLQHACLLNAKSWVHSIYLFNSSFYTFVSIICIENQFTKHWHEFLLVNLWITCNLSPFECLMWATFLVRLPECLDSTNAHCIYLFVFLKSFNGAKNFRPDANAVICRHFEVWPTWNWSQVVDGCGILSR